MDFTLTPELIRDIQFYACLVIVMLGSLTIHEYAHARIALAFGDPTAYKLGRVSLNPIRHLDPMGTILFIFAQVGWGKPVPVNPFLLRPPRLGDVMVSAGGPLSNLAIAIISLGCIKILKVIILSAGIVDTSLIHVLLMFLRLSFAVNIGLFIFNLVPLYPLDGHHILKNFFPPDRHEGFMRWQIQFGVYILIALWVGPDLLRRVTGQKNIPDPIGWLIGNVQHYFLSWVR